MAVALCCSIVEEYGSHRISGRCTDVPGPCSAQTQREIDQKVVELVKAQHAKALQILTENRDKLDQLAKFLYEKETITGEEFMAILNGEEKTE